MSHWQEDAARVTRRARRLALQAMLRQNRALVADEIADAILSSQDGGLAADPLQRARGEQASADAATARRIGKWRT